MTDAEILQLWRNADSPVKVEPVLDGTRIQWDDDPLNFIVLAPKAVSQLIEALEAAHGR